MQLSETTLDILRNFSAINQNMLIKQGNTLKTISEARAVVATANIAESFPRDNGIYDLNEFIGVMGLVFYGFINYYNKQRKDHKKNWDFLKFLVKTN